MISGLGSGRRELVCAPPATTRPLALTYLACSAASQRLLSVITRRTASPAPLLISGETGTGKTLLARTVHETREQGPRTLHVINCAALHDALLDEALAPLSHAAEGTTVLLDEVGELSPRGQAQLVALLEHRSAGSGLIASTQRDLEALTAAGQFSRPLFEEIAGVRVSLTPLRKRREEIVPLALHFLSRALVVAGLPSVSVEHELLGCLHDYAWPGNVRELQNAMLEAIALSDGEILAVRDLPDRVQRGTRVTAAQPAL
jgi:DNA-binding NtrC family response regulator